MVISTLGVKKVFYMKKPTRTEIELDVVRTFIERLILKEYESLTTNGLSPSHVYEEYCKSTPFPMGLKSFSPLVRQYGLTRIIRNGRPFYVLMET